MRFTKRRQAIPDLGCVIVAVLGRFVTVALLLDSHLITSPAAAWPLLKDDRSGLCHPSGTPPHRVGATGARTLSGMLVAMQATQPP